MLVGPVLVEYARRAPTRRMRRHLAAALGPHIRDHRVRIVGGARVREDDRTPKWLPPHWVRRRRDGSWVLSCSASRVAHPAARRRLEEAASAVLGARHMAEWQPGSATVILHPQRLPDRLGPPDRPRRGLLDVGVDTAGRPVLLRMDDPRSAHILAVGSTGSGKSTVTQTMILQAARWANVVLVDVKQIDFADLDGHRRIRRVTSYEDAADAIADVRAEMHARYERMERGDRRFGPLLLAVDEAAELRSMAVEHDGSKAQVFADLSSILRLGQAARVHCLLGVQRPDLTDLPLASP